MRVIGRDPLVSAITPRAGAKAGVATEGGLAQVPMHSTMRMPGTSLTFWPRTAQFGAKSSSRRIKRKGRVVGPSLFPVIFNGRSPCIRFPAPTVARRAPDRIATQGAFYEGVGMKTIQRLMGHRHIGTAALYCEVSDETLRNAVDLL